MTKKEENYGVSIGDVKGSISNSIIAGRDVQNATISIGGKETRVDKTPSIDELSQLLNEIQYGMAQVLKEQDVLKEISVAAPHTALGAEVIIKDATEKIQPGIQTDEAKSVEQGLKEATSLLSTILTGAKTVIEKGGEVAKAAQPFVETLAPLAEKVAVAAIWSGKLATLVV